MALLRYAAQEAANIAAAETRARQELAFMVSLANRAADEKVADASATAAAATAAKLQWTTAPGSAAATGTAGQLAYDSGFIYICIASGNWVRAALATW